jgi:origin recognition complex subunit 5
MIAILGSLLEENDVDTRRPAREFRIPGEYTDMEIGRVGIYSTVGLLVIHLWLLKIEMRRHRLRS